MTRQIFDRINQERSKAGLGELKWDDQIAAAAEQHASEMVRHGELSHQFPGEPDARHRIIATGVRVDASGENVAFGPDVENLVNGWMQSPGHRANILDPKYNATGIGVAVRGMELWAVQDFARRLPTYSNADVETIVATQLTRARADARLSDIQLVQAPDVRAAACDMAQKGDMEAGSLAHNLKRVRSVFTFTTSEPQRLPKNLVRVGAGAAAFSVGSCFAKTPKYPEGTNWVVVAFY